MSERAKPYVLPAGATRRERAMLPFMVEVADKRAEYFRDEYLFLCEGYTALLRHRRRHTMYRARACPLPAERRSFPFLGCCPRHRLPPTRMPQIGWTLWRSKPYLDSIAHEMGRQSALHMVRSWLAVRVKYQTLGFQDGSHTLWPFDDG